MLGAALSRRGEREARHRPSMSRYPPKPDDPARLHAAHVDVPVTLDDPARDEIRDDVSLSFAPTSRQTVYGLFRRCQRQGVWARLLTLLQARADTAGLITWEVNVDSTVCRAHQHAAGARRDGAGQKEPPGGVVTEPDDHGLGRSRGGFTTKIHLACEQGSGRAPRRSCVSGASTVRPPGP